MPRELFDWSAENLQRLRQLWDEGHSTNEIAKRLGCSKNSVVGKAHRIRLEPRQSPIHDKGTGRPRRIPARTGTTTLIEFMPHVPAMPEQEPERGSAPRAPLPEPLTRNHAGCLWPMWGYKERPTHLYCGAEPRRRATEAGPLIMAYCEEHHRKAFVRGGTKQSERVTIEELVAWARDNSVRINRDETPVYLLSRVNEARQARHLLPFQVLGAPPAL